MIRLHLVGFTPDLKGLVFSGRRGGKTGTYWVPVNDAFMRALDQLETARREAAGTAPKKGSAKAAPAAAPGGGRQAPAEAAVAEVLELLPKRQLRALREAAATAERSQSRLTPKDIQQMLREGRTVKEVAAQAGVEEAWVERFEGPVLHEMAGMIQMTRDGYQTRPRLGRSGLSVGRAIQRNLIDRKATSQTMSELEDGWEARRTNTRAWRVRLRFTHRGKRRLAEWELLREAGTVRPRNQLARELGWWAPDVTNTVSLEDAGEEGAEGDVAAADQPQQSEQTSRSPRQKTAKTSRSPRSRKAAKTRKPAPRSRKAAASRAKPVRKTASSKSKASTSKKKPKAASSKRATTAKKSSSKSAAKTRKTSKTGARKTSASKPAAKSRRSAPARKSRSSR
ncbi:MAG TPA: septation protein SepH [Actinomycetota bacterium]|nr:septation protein SepH [Actinomycetota bacterium]